MTHHCHSFEINGESYRLSSPHRKEGFRTSKIVLACLRMEGYYMPKGVADLHADPWLSYMPITIELIVRVITVHKRKAELL